MVSSLTPLNTSSGQNKNPIQILTPTTNSNPYLEKPLYGPLKNSRVISEKLSIASCIFDYSKLQKKDAPRSFTMRKVVQEHIIQANHKLIQSHLPPSRRCQTKEIITPGISNIASTQVAAPSTVASAPQLDALDIFLKENSKSQAKK